MITVVGVRFRNVGKIYYFDPTGFDLNQGDKVIVETARGKELGTVLLAPREVHEESVVMPLKGIERVATEKDVEQSIENREKEKEACKICKEKIEKHELDMKLVGAEYTFDRNKLLFYFTSDGRVDFRELVKDLAAVFRTRIELRQIGVRDEAKIVGGIGICGRELCCASYLSDFVPVSVKMAKEQGLSLNPTKISGCCGRLMCCLKNENDTYKYLNSKLPNKGDIVKTPTGREAKVEELSVLRQTVTVVVEGEDDIMEKQTFHVDELEFQSKKKKIEVTAEESAELKGLEDAEELAEVNVKKDKNHKDKKNYKKDKKDFKKENKDYKKDNKNHKKNNKKKFDKNKNSDK